MLNAIGGNDAGGSGGATGGAKESASRGTLRDLRNASDDEILGLNRDERKRTDDPLEDDEDQTEGGESALADERQEAEHKDGEEKDRDEGAESEELKGILDGNPELRRAWEEAPEYRKVFSTPEEARNARALVADLNRMDALFFSRKAEDHARLAKSIAETDPEAFASLAAAMGAMAVDLRRARGTEEGSTAKVVDAKNAEAQGARGEGESAHGNRTDREPMGRSGAGLSAEQTNFLQAANAAAVQSVIGAIEAQVERLLPEGASKSAKNRVVGEIYRELDSTLRANRQLSQQMRDAFRSGGLDAEHQRAIVSLVTGRARQTLPGVAKRVMNEWTSTVMAANQDRRARQRAAERRVDIGGSGGAGSEGRRSMTPREIDYARMSDGDILNL